MPTIADTLKYANLQMAAEALYGFDANVKPVPWGSEYNGTALSQ